MDVKKGAIIFDFGGVLIDWDPRYLYRKFFDGDSAGMEAFLAEIGFTEWNRRQDAGRSFAEGVAELSSRYPQYAELIKAYDERWQESVAGPIRPVVDILVSIKAAGYPLGGLSNWSAEKFKLVRNQYEFFEWFDQIVISGEVCLAKPDPEIFSVLLERLGCTAPQCLFIDDSSVNIQVARGMGFNTIRYRSPEQLKQELRKKGIAFDRDSSVERN